MELTPKQLEGLNIAVQRYRNHERYTVISGYAGSGKSTLVKFIVAALQVPEEQIIYACFTGKACNVLQQKGCKNVCTLHRLLYEWRPKKDGGFVRIPYTELEYDIVIVDEVSMASKELMTQLFTHDVYVICLGDPFQLPPINPDDDNHLLDSPHIFLDEIHRQAQESEIIRISMDIRAQRLLEKFDGKDVKIIGREDLVNGMYTWADQILCATNETRININNEMRALAGLEGDPKDGDKIICLKNQWDILDSAGDPLVNGTIGYLKNPYSRTLILPYRLGGTKFEIINSDVVTETNTTFEDLNMDKKLILTGQPALDWKTKYALNKNMKTQWMVPMEFTYGYAITCHKAQGSQWDNVLVIEERFPFAQEEHARWLYTALTRAAKKLIIVKKD